jgi:hypothetical protein
LSSDSLDRLRPLFSEQWQSLVRTIAPTVQHLIDEDQASGRPQTQRLRLGLYAYADRMPDIPADPAEQNDTEALKAAPRRRKKT